MIVSHCFVTGKMYFSWYDPFSTHIWQHAKRNRNTTWACTLFPKRFPCCRVISTTWARVIHTPAASPLIIPSSSGAPVIICPTSRPSEFIHASTGSTVFVKASSWATVIVHSTPWSAVIVKAPPGPTVIIKAPPEPTTIIIKAPSGSTVIVSSSAWASLIIKATAESFVIRTTTLRSFSSSPEGHFTVIVFSIIVFTPLLTPVPGREKDDNELQFSASVFNLCPYASGYQLMWKLLPVTNRTSPFWIALSTLPPASFFLFTQVLERKLFKFRPRNNNVHFISEQQYAVIIWLKCQYSFCEELIVIEITTLHQGSIK